VFSANTSGWIGIDLGCSTVKLAQLRKRHEGFVFGSAVLVRRDTPWHFSDWRNVDDQSSTGEIRAARQLAERFDGRRAACILPMSCYDLHDTQLPDSHESVEELVERAVGDLYGQIDSYEYDYWITPDNKRGGPMEVNTLAVSSNRTLSVAQDCRQNRLQLEAVDGYPLALDRTVSMMHAGSSNSSALGSSGPTVVIDFGYTDATFCLVHQELPAYIRTMRNCGFKRWLDAVQSGLELTMDEAETLLYRHGLPSPESKVNEDISRTVADVVQDPLQDLVAEISRTLSYLTAQRGCSPPERLVLLGGGASTKALPEILEAELSMPAMLWNLNGAKTVKTRDVEIPATLFALAASASALVWQEVAA
jgi:Tfp pilus assembly PilM family ATPase